MARSTSHPSEFDLDSAVFMRPPPATADQEPAAAAAVGVRRPRVQRNRHRSSTSGACVAMVEVDGAARTDRDDPRASTYDVDTARPIELNRSVVDRPDGSSQVGLVAVARRGARRDRWSSSPASGWSLGHRGWSVSSRTAPTPWPPPLPAKRARPSVSARRRGPPSSVSLDVRGRRVMTRRDRSSAWSTRGRCNGSCPSSLFEVPLDVDGVVEMEANGPLYGTARGVDGDRCVARGGGRSVARIGTVPTRVDRSGRRGTRPTVTAVRLPRHASVEPCSVMVRPVRFGHSTTPAVGSWSRSARSPDDDVRICCDATAPTNIACDRRGHAIGCW